MKAVVTPICEEVEGLDKDYKLRWFGFSTGENIGTAEFKDANNRQWIVRFCTTGEQRCNLKEETLIELFNQKNKDLLEFIKDSKGEIKNDIESVIDFFDDIISIANEESISESDTSYITFLDKNKCINFSYVCNIEAECTVKENDEVIFEEFSCDYSSAYTYSSFSEIKEKYSNQDYLEKLVTTLSPNFNS